MPVGSRFYLKWNGGFFDRWLANNSVDSSFSPAPERAVIDDAAGVFSSDGDLQPFGPGDGPFVRCGQADVLGAVGGADDE